jgi:hypothetical protein
LEKIRAKLNKEKTKPTDVVQTQDQATKATTTQTQVQPKKSLKSLIYYYISFGYWNNNPQSDSTLKKD